MSGGAEADHRLATQRHFAASFHCAGMFGTALFGDRPSTLGAAERRKLFVLAMDLVAVTHAVPALLGRPSLETVPAGLLRQWAGRATSWLDEVFSGGRIRVPLGFVSVTLGSAKAATLRAEEAEGRSVRRKRGVQRARDKAAAFLAAVDALDDTEFVAMSPLNLTRRDVPLPTPEDAILALERSRGSDPELGRLDLTVAAAQLMPGRGGGAIEVLGQRTELPAAETQYQRVVADAVARRERTLLDPRRTTSELRQVLQRYIDALYVFPWGGNDNDRDEPFKQRYFGRCWVSPWKVDDKNGRAIRDSVERIAREYGAAHDYTGVMAWSCNVGAVGD